MSSNQKVFVLSREGISGEDETLSFEILVSMLEALAGREVPPAALVFWNTAVRLLTASSPVLNSLKRLEERGVFVLAAKL